jgi:hypothetical protein
MPDCLVSVFHGFNKVNAQIPFAKVLDDIRTGTYKEQINRLRELLQQKESKKYSSLKKHLPAFTPSGNFEGGRKYDFLKKYSGLIILDIDKLSADQLIQAKEKINGDFFTKACFTSPGGQGLKIIVKTDTDAEQHKQAFEQVKNYYEQLLKLPIDPSGKDITRLCFYSYDENLFHNPDSKIFHFSKDVLEEQICRIVQQIEKHQIDITSDYNDWIKIAFALIDAMGEAARSYFHKVSSFYPGYEYQECDKQFDKCLKSDNSGITVKTFFKFAKDHGIDISQTHKLQKPTRIDIDNEMQGHETLQTNYQKTDNSFLPEFPHEVFPTAVSKFIVEAAEAINCPADFIGVSVMATLASAIGSSFVIQLKNGWTEPPIFFSAIIADPGSKKSPALSSATIPIKEIQKQYAELFYQQKKQYEKELCDFETFAEEWKHKSKQEKAKASRPQKPVAPSLKQLITNDATIEALADLLCNNPKGILFIQDELAGWVKGMNQYRNGKGSDQEKWLSFWNGSQTIINRKSQEEPLVLNNPFVSVIGCLPPDIISDLSGGKNNGFVDRILFAFPDPVPAKYSEIEISSGTISGYCNVFNKIYEMNAVADEFGNIAPVHVALSETAKERWIAWFNEHCSEINSSRLPYYLKGIWSKLQGYTARFALILELSHNVKKRIDNLMIGKESMDGAIKLTDYFKANARKVHELINSSDMDKKITKTVEWIQNNGNKTTLRQIYVNRVAGCKNHKEAMNILSEMEYRNIGVMEEIVNPSGGKKTYCFGLRG